MDPVTLALIVLAVFVALGIGWFLGGRGSAALIAEKADLADRLEKTTEQRNAAFKDIAVEQERAGQAAGLRDRLDIVQAEREAALRELAALHSDQRARTEAFEAQIKALTEAKEQLSAQFSEIGGKLLGEAQRQFLERADQRFGQAHEKSEAQLKALLQPVNETIKLYDQKISQIEQQRTEAYGNLTGLIESMRVGQEAVRSEAQRLVNSLRAAPKARGRWGEQQLRNVLESCGLSEHADFQTEVSVEGEDGRLRPDAIIRVPGGRALVIDAKVSLNSYQDAYGADSEEERRRHMAAHAAAMKAHVDTLGRKSYADQFDEVPDYVIMFVPGEHFLSAALEQEPSLWDFAFSRRVLLATPTNLIAIARTVAAVWRQEKMADEAKRIGALGKELYERMAVAAGALRKLGNRLNGAVADYNAFSASFETRVLVTGRKFRDLNVETGGKEIEMIEPVDALARMPGSPEGLRALPDLAEPGAEAAE
ncbi:DNA recombination protein RmuC [Sphingobium phenoxybenzoativorans]|uniref:DNA recombination protein RmuC homolog n=1 Tax=Sphingobium phenoxybenzoativorans TaxID=1592790 RepID=A0A975KA15_9SPHN|nr:DNA recombination protein RmuC [Sphingobium phenoxybenzoativorans]QUT07550.1 DNA recombination protein RmuC [Sphingobium phenoxybenzoativorans]